MSKSKKLLISCLYLFIQGCSSSSPMQAGTFSPTSISSTPKPVQTSPTSTHAFSPATPSYTSSPPPLSLEDLETIDSSNITSLVKLFEIQSHGGYAISLYWSPDSKKVHLLKVNGTIEMWDIQDRSSTKILESAKQNSYSIGWYPSKNLVAYLDNTTYEVSVWDLENNRFLFNLGMYTAFPFINAESVSWSPDGSKIISTGWDNTLRVWDATTGAQIKVIENKSLWYESVVWSPNGAFIAVGHKNGTVYVIETNTWKIVNEFSGHNNGHEGGVPTVAWSPDGTKIASGGRDEEKVFIWNPMGTRLYELNNEPLSVFGLNWSPDSKMVAASGEGWDVVITDISTGSELLRIGDHKPNTYCVAWSPNGKLLVTVTSNGKIQIWGIRP